MAETLTEESKTGEQTQAQPQAAEQKPATKPQPKREHKAAVPKAVYDAHSTFDEQIDEDEKPKKGGEADTTVADKGKTKEEEKPVAETQPEAKPGEQKPETTGKVDSQLLARAAKAGLTLGQAMSFSSSQDLEGALAIFEGSHKPDEKPAGDGKAAEEEVPEKFDCGLNPEEYDEGIIKAMNTMGQTVLDLRKQLKTEKAKSESGGKDAAIEAHTAWLDSQFSGLTEGETLFGKGNIGDIKPGTDAFKNRAAIDREVIAIAAGYKATGQPMPPKDKIFQRAVNNLFGEQIKQAKETKTKEKLGNRANQTIGRGSQAASTEENKALKVQQDFDAMIDEEG